jgi:hypothetical protein
MTYYKIVQKVKRKLKSCMVPNWDIDADLMNLLCIEYKVNEYVYPKLEGSKLYVFSNLDSASKFLNIIDFYNKDKCVIYECEVENPGKIKPLYCINSIVNYWKKKKSHKSTSNFLINKTKGFVSCDAVKLTKRVKL